MYEKLDKLREEVRRCEKRAIDAQNRLKAAQEKLKESEASQILADVGAMKLSPEKLAQVLALVKSGQLKSESGMSEEAEVRTEKSNMSDSWEMPDKYDEEDEQKEVIEDEEY